MAGCVAGVAGAVGLVTAALAVSGGQPWQTMNDLALLVLVGALAPLMLAFYQLGGLTPTGLAQLAQTLGWASVLTFGAIQVLQLVGAVAIDWRAPAVGAFAVGSLALAYIGLWIAGANLLAGPWLGQERWLGVAAGLAVVVFAAGLLRGGVDTALTALGGFGFLVLVPVWALPMARVLSRLPPSD